MARQKEPVHRVQMTEGKRNIIYQLLEEYDIPSVEDIQDALKDLLGGTIKEMMEAEMDEHLGYEKSETSVYKGYKRDKIEMRGDRAEISDFPLYLNTVAGGLDRRDQTIGGFSFVVKIYAVPVVEIIG